MGELSCAGGFYRGEVLAGQPHGKGQFFTMLVRRADDCRCHRAKKTRMEMPHALQVQPSAGHTTRSIALLCCMALKLPYAQVQVVDCARFLSHLMLCLEPALPLSSRCCSACSCLAATVRAQQH